MTSLISNVSKTVGVAAVGAVASRASMWLSRQVEQTTGLSIGGLLHPVVPEGVTNFLKTAAKFINFPLTFTAEKLRDTYITQPYATDMINSREYGRRTEKLNRLFKVVLAPLIEELSFRGLVQTVGGMALEGIGVSPLVAQGSAILIANTLFVLAHLEDHEDFSAERFSPLFAGGLVDSIICNQFGLTASIAEHALSNLSNEWLKI